MGCTSSTQAADNIPSSLRDLHVLHYYREHHDTKDPIHIIAVGLISIINDFNTGNYMAAYDMMINDAFLDSVGYHLKINYKLFGVGERGVEYFTKKAKFFAEDKRIELKVPLIGTSSIDPNIRHPGNDPMLAMAILPIFLEEYIHLFQHLIGGYLSPDTRAFRKSCKSKKGDNFNEVDICAFYRDLKRTDMKWDAVVTKEFCERYTYRKRFWKFVEGNNGCGCVSAVTKLFKRESQKSVGGGNGAGLVPAVTD